MSTPHIPADQVPSPCYLLDQQALARNLALMDTVQQQSGAKIILALKGFAMFATFPLINKVLQGTTASSIHEARLGLEEFGGEVHAYLVAYQPDEIEWFATRARHITLNSLSQWERYKNRTGGSASFGMRINPEYSEVSTDIYNPCRKGSRFGVTAEQLESADLSGLEGLHFHTMCEQNSDTLKRTLDVIEVKFGKWLHHMKWLNMGGGHHITRADYDVDLLCECVRHMRSTYDLEVYLEPGEAVALNTGYLICTVVDLFDNIAILDTSATAHMPDVLEMPYRPEIIGAAKPGEKEFSYSLGGLTCLAGDVIGEYAFDTPLEIGSKLIFTDMAHYTMVKNSTFNGVQLPSIARYDPETGKVDVLRRFGYEDYRNRLS